MATLEEFETLLNAVGQGDRRAFHQLYSITAPKLFGLCRAILDDDDWADEVLEQAFIDIWQQSIRWQDSGLTALTWVLSMVREYAIAARREASGDGVPDPVELQSIAPSKKVEDVGEGPEPLLRKVLGWLPADRRDAFLLSYFSGMRYSELATRYRVPYATIRNWQRRSLSRIHADLSGNSATEDVILAGEFVLDVIPALEQEDFVARLSADLSLQQAVAGWTEDFIVLTDSIHDVRPQPDLLQRLDRILFPEQAKSVLQRTRFSQTIVWVAVAGVLLWAAYEFWPGVNLGFGMNAQRAPLQAVSTLEEPSDIIPMPETGDPIAWFQREDGIMQFGGDLAPLSETPNLQVYLDFGDNTEWISLGAWPELPPRLLTIPDQLAAIVQGAEVVILGGEGSDQEVLRIAVE